MGGIVNQTALASAGEVTVVVPLLLAPGGQGMPRNYTAPQAGAASTAFLVLAQILVAAIETNVTYVTEVDQSAVGPNSVRLKVRQLGPAAGAQVWGVNVFVLDIGDTIS